MKLARLTRFEQYAFCRLRVVSAQCVFGTGRNPKAGILINYDDDDYSQGYRQIKETFRGLIEDDSLQQYISDQDFRSSNVMADDVGNNFFVFNIRY